MHIIAGLGNPGEKYEHTRHNAGRRAVSAWVEARKGSFVASKKYRGLIYEGKIGKESMLALLPDTFMNESGGSIQKAVPSKKVAEGLILIYDDIDLPLGVIRISFNRGSGGHNGARSVENALKTQGFTRIRIGISPKGRKGAKRPQGEEAVLKAVLGEWKSAEAKELQSVLKRVGEAIECIIKEGVPTAMNRFN